MEHFYRVIYNIDKNPLGISIVITSITNRSTTFKCHAPNVGYVKKVRLKKSKYSSGNTNENDIKLFRRKNRFIESPRATTNIQLQIKTSSTRA